MAATADDAAAGALWTSTANSGTQCGTTFCRFLGEPFRGVGPKKINPNVCASGALGSNVMEPDLYASARPCPGPEMPPGPFPVRSSLDQGSTAVSLALRRQPTWLASRQKFESLPAHRAADGQSCAKGRWQDDLGYAGQTIKSARYLAATVVPQLTLFNWQT